mgnify:CR=1 FL=1
MKTSKQKIKRKIMIQDFKRRYFDMEKVKEQSKLEYLIDIIKGMDIKDKLRLAICMNDSEWLTLDYDKKEMYNKFDSKLKEIGQEYRTILINFGQSKYFIINFAMSKLMEMEQTDRNKVALYLFNNIKIQ